MSWTGGLKARQIKAARALLNWSQQDLAKASRLSVATIRKLELGNISPRGKTNDLLRRSFEGAGLEFMVPDGVRHCPQDIKIYEGLEGAYDFYDDVYACANKGLGSAVIIHPSAKKYYADMLGKYAELHTARMTAIKDRVDVKCLVCEDSGVLPAKSYCEYRLVSKNYVNVAPSYVYGNKYALIILDAAPSPKIVVIESKAVAEAFRLQFYSIWEKAAPLNTLDYKNSVFPKTSGKK